MVGVNRKPFPRFDASRGRSNPLLNDRYCFLFWGSVAKELRRNAPDATCDAHDNGRGRLTDTVCKKAPRPISLNAKSQNRWANAGERAHVSISTGARKWLCVLLP